MAIKTKRKLILVLIFLGLLIFGLNIHSNLKNNTDFHRADTLNWITTSKGSLHLKTYKNVNTQDSVNLVIVIHGDAPFEKPDYQYHFAENIARQNKNTIAIGILRPGYTDPDNNTSNGIKGFTTGDNYTLAVNEAIAEAILQLKKSYHPIKTILIGHSGGAAIAGDIIGLKPNLVNSAILVSCPCNLPEWRKYMHTKQMLNLAWWFNFQSISPIAVADSISEETEVTIVVGDKDDVAPVYLSKEYYDKLKSLNKKCKLVLIPNEGHEILLNDKVMNEVRDLIN